MADERPERPGTTLLKGVLTLTFCACCFALLMAVGTAVSWVVDPVPRPETWLGMAGGFVLVLGLWALNTSVFLAVFAGIPWLILHLLGARSWWLAPAAGFVVAFGSTFWWTISAGHPPSNLNTSMWLDDQAVMLDGTLTPYGATLYGPGAATFKGVCAGVVGAVLGLVMWLLAYGRKPARPLRKERIDVKAR